MLVVRDENYTHPRLDRVLLGQLFDNGTASQPPTRVRMKYAAIDLQMDCLVTAFCTREVMSTE